MDRELWMSQWETFCCMGTYQHLDESQFLTIITINSKKETKENKTFKFNMIKFFLN